MKIAKDYALDYLSQWTYDKPIIITPETNQKFQRIQKLLFKAICHFSENYEKYKHLMPISKEAEAIISLCKEKPYLPGTYRTDFVIDVENQIKLIEITCRFALNGLFFSGFYHLIADQYLSDKPHIRKTDAYSRLFDYFIELWGDFDHICLLKGDFDNNESKYAVPIFKEAGFKVHVIPASAIPENTHLFDRAILISELNQENWFHLPKDVIMKMVNAKLFNDPRTIFLIHDKRFFSVFHDEAFLNAVFSKDEIKEICQYIVPTFRPDERPDLWADARKNRENWIVKPFAMGRSINVFAGCCTPENEWENLFLNGMKEQMILQPYINQRKYKGTLKGKDYEDYGAGLLLFYNDNYFGPGVFRASSFQVTNKVDDRKIVPIVTNDIKDSDTYILV